MDVTPFSSAKSIADAIRQRNTTSEDVLEMYHERICELNGIINAVVDYDYESARRKAVIADKQMDQKNIVGPLHGLPVTIKDQFETVGFNCTSGFSPLKDYRPNKNADIVQDIIDAGAFVMGKSNLPPMGGDLQTYNEVYGQTNNPWGLGYTPGGSSGGSAAALAAGFTSFEFGTDIGGSIRIPAHCCGVYGHKPSHGLISLGGCIPPMPNEPPGTYLPTGDIAVAGPMSRSAQDLSMLLDVCSVVRPHLSKGWSFQYPKPRGSKLSDFKIGLWLDDTYCPVDSLVGECIEEFCSQISRHGGQLYNAKPDFSLSECTDVYIQLMCAVNGSGIDLNSYNDLRDQAGNVLYGANDYVSNRLKGYSLSYRDWVELDRMRSYLRFQWEEYFNEYDALICPVMPVTAFPHDHSPIMNRKVWIDGVDTQYYRALLPWVGLASVAYLPATAIPAGLAKNGLPVGVQVVGPYLEDKTTTAIAECIENHLGGFSTPPMPHISSCG